MELTPIQKLREDIRSYDSSIYLYVLALLVEAEGQEKAFLEKVYNEPKTTEFEEYYKQFGKPK
jgi:hypothetical protein